MADENNNDDKPRSLAIDPAWAYLFIQDTRTPEEKDEAQRKEECAPQGQGT